MVETKTIKCAFCQGTGKDPFELLSKMATCQVCGGERKVTVPVPHVTCPVCGGSGIQPHTRLVCRTCGGKGIISPERRKEVLERKYEFN